MPAFQSFVAMINRFLFMIFMSGAFIALFVPSCIRNFAENKKLKQEQQERLLSEEQLKKDAQAARQEAYVYKQRNQVLQNERDQMSTDLANSQKHTSYLERQLEERETYIAKAEKTIDSLRGDVTHYASLGDSLSKNIALFRRYTRRLQQRLVQQASQISALQQLPSRERQLILIIAGISLIALFLAIVILLQRSRFKSMAIHTPLNTPTRTKGTSGAFEAQLN